MKPFFHLMLWTICQDIGAHILLFREMPDCFYSVIEYRGEPYEFNINPNYYGYQGSFASIKAEMTRVLTWMLDRCQEDR